MSIRLLDHGFTSFLSIVHGVLSLFQLDDCLTSWSLVTTLGWIDRYRHSHRPCLFFSPRPAFISPRGNFVTWSITRALCWCLVGRIHWPCGRGIQSTVYKNLSWTTFLFLWQYVYTHLDLAGGRWPPNNDHIHNLAGGLRNRRLGRCWFRVNVALDSLSWISSVHSGKYFLTLRMCLAVCIYAQHRAEFNLFK